MNGIGHILLTGGCGFIGHHLASRLLNDGYTVTIMDNLTYASDGYDRLRQIGLVHDIDFRHIRRNGLRVFTHDIAQPLTVLAERELGPIDAVLHLGAETHVDRSIDNAEPFVMTNVLGTYRMLELARRKGVKLFHYFSTDEVFGPAPSGVAFDEYDRYNSGNPYAATKAGGEELAVAYANTYKLPVIVTHTMNVFGERQHEEKFIPKTIMKILSGSQVTIHADPTRSVPGSRFYLYVDDLCDAMSFLVAAVSTGQLPERYGEKWNIVGEREVSNLEVAQYLARMLGRSLDFELVDFHSSRPGHDLRYALSGSRLAALGWSHRIGFEQGLQRTVNFYRERFVSVNNI